MNLRVISPFPGHELGELITDDEEVEKVLETHPQHVVKVAEEAADSDK